RAAAQKKGVRESAKRRVQRAKWGSRGAWLIHFARCTLRLALHTYVRSRQEVTAHRPVGRPAAVVAERGAGAGPPAAARRAAAAGGGAGHGAQRHLPRLPVGAGAVVPRPREAPARPAGPRLLR